MIVPIISIFMYQIIFWFLIFKNNGLRPKRLFQVKWGVYNKIKGIAHVKLISHEYYLGFSLILSVDALFLGAFSRINLATFNGSLYHFPENHHIDETLYGVSYQFFVVLAQCVLTKKHRCLFFIRGGRICVAKFHHLWAYSLKLSIAFFSRFCKDNMSSACL